MRAGLQVCAADGGLQLVEAKVGFTVDMRRGKGFVRQRLAAKRQEGGFVTPSLHHDDPAGDAVLFAPGLLFCGGDGACRCVTDEEMSPGDDARVQRGVEGIHET